MISSNDIRPGTNIKIDNDIWQVIEFQHVKPGKGAAFVRSKLKNLRTGNTNEKTFRAGEKLEKANIEKKEMQFSYADGNDYIFMDNETFDEMRINKSELGNVILYIKEGTSVNMMLSDGAVIGVEPPNFIVLKIVETDPAYKGDTAQGGTKPAKLETGAVVAVPFFVLEGDSIKIDTRTNSYLERAST
ncbi:MAG: elongation factor P [Candidatus Sericytochromatia bacterium]|nr:elongation factor P [Candidatus Sericytochromatia bacterium]